MKNFILSTLVLISSLGLLAQNPDLINYQAVIRDIDGKIVSSKAISLRFSIHKGGTAGTMEYQEVHAVSSDLFGVVSTQIGAGNVVSGSMASLDWGSDTFAIKVEVSLDGTNNYSQLSFKNLTSVPYAMHAKSADNVDDADADTTNELISSFTFAADTLVLADAGGSYQIDLTSLNQSAQVSQLQNQRSQDSLNTATALLLISNKQKADSTVLAGGIAANGAQLTALSGKVIADSTLLAGQIAAISTKQAADSAALGSAIASNTAAIAADMDGDTTNEIQSLSISNDTISLTNGGSIKLPVSVNNDNDSTNEIQTLSISNDTISLTNGGQVVLPSVPVNNDNDSSNELIDSIYVSGDNLIVVEAGGANRDTVDLSAYNVWTKNGSAINFTTGNVSIGTTAQQGPFRVLDGSSGFGAFIESNSTSNQNIAVTAEANSSSSNNNNMYGVYGEASGGASTGTGIHYGTYGRSTGAGTLGIGAYGQANGSVTSRNRGVEGQAAGSVAEFNQGVFGSATISRTSASGYNAGLVGQSSGHSTLNYATLGLQEGTGNSNYGGAFFAYGAAGSGKFNYGSYGYAWGADTNIAVYGYAADDASNTNIGVYGRANTANGSLAGRFKGNVRVEGNLTITGSISKGSGTFKIDHPKDPENKYLIHSFVESPDMMNVYNGNATTDAQGLVTVTLPDYFEATNKEFRYQLTPIGQFAQCIIKEEINNNTFVIQTDKPNVKVSWQVTGIRNDPYSNKNRIIPEVEKDQSDRGYYLHPEAYGLDESKSIFKPIGKGHTDEQLEKLKDSRGSGSSELKD